MNFQMKTFAISIGLTALFACGGPDETDSAQVESAATSSCLTILQAEDRAFKNYLNCAGSYAGGYNARQCRSYRNAWDEAYERAESAGCFGR